MFPGNRRSATGRLFDCGLLFNERRFFLHGTLRRNNLRFLIGGRFRLTGRHLKRSAVIFRSRQGYARQYTGNAFKNGVYLADAGDLRDFILLTVILNQRQRLIFVNAQAVDDGSLNIIVTLHQRLTRFIINARRLRRIVFKVISPARRGMNTPPGQAFNNQVKRHLNGQYAINIQT